jgi:hypothetical protein
MNQEKITQKIFDLWDEGIKDENTIIEMIQSEFQVSTNDAETIFDLTQVGALRAAFITSGKDFPASNLNNNPIVKAAIKIALSNLGKSDLYKEPVKQRPWWIFWK